MVDIAYRLLVLLEQRNATRTPNDSNEKSKYSWLHSLSRGFAMNFGSSFGFWMCGLDVILVSKKPMADCYLCATPASLPLHHLGGKIMLHHFGSVAMKDEELC